MGTLRFEFQTFELPSAVRCTVSSGCSSFVFCPSIALHFSNFIFSAGIATSLYSSLHVKLNLAVLTLTEKGDLTRLENRWWYESSECKGNQNPLDVKEMQTSLTIDNVEGIFYILLGGLCCSMIVAIIDLTCRCYKEAVRDKVSAFLAVRVDHFALGQRISGVLQVVIFVLDRKVALCSRSEQARVLMIIDLTSNLVTNLVSINE